MRPAVFHVKLAQPAQAVRSTEPLEDFAPVGMGVLWRGEASELLRAVIEEVGVYTRAIWPEE